MQQILLERWQALEIFSKLIVNTSKKPGLIKLSSLKDLKEQIEPFRNKAFAEPIMQRVLADQPDEDAGSSSGNTGFLYDLARKLRQSEPLLVNPTPLNKCIKFINKRENKPMDLGTLFVCKPWNVEDDTIDLFQDSYWWLHHFEYRTQTLAGTPQIQNGIVKSIMKFGKFGRVELYSFNQSKKAPETYLGYYKAGGIGKTFLELQLKLTEGVQRDLQFRFAIGTGKINLALGIYSNWADTMYSGRVVLERTTAKAIKNYKPSFVTKEMNIAAEGVNKIDEYYWRFFNDRDRNWMELPLDITELSTLQSRIGAFE